MTTVKEPVREFLESYHRLRVEEKRLERKIEELECQCVQVTAKLSGMPRGGGSGGRNATWDTLVDTKDKTLKTLKEALERSAEIEDFVDRIENETHKVLLKLRYLERMTWDQIADEMCYDDRYIYKLHGKALDSARALWDRLYPTKKEVCAATGLTCIRCNPGACDSRRSAT